MDEREREDALIADMRANGGVVTHGPLAGHPLLVLTATGARTGLPRRVILTRSRDGQAYVVAGTDSGAPTPPSWLANVQANPEVGVETEDQRFRARAEVFLEGPERERLWAQHVAALPHLARYPEQARRPIPMVRLHRIEGSESGGAREAASTDREGGAPPDPAGDAAGAARMPPPR